MRPAGFKDSVATRICGATSSIFGRLGARPIFDQDSDSATLAQALLRESVRARQVGASKEAIAVPFLQNSAVVTITTKIANRIANEDT